jgi:hypothetical protein
MDERCLPAKTTSAAAGDAMGDGTSVAGVANEAGFRPTTSAGGRCDGEESGGDELRRGRERREGCGLRTLGKCERLSADTA